MNRVLDSASLRAPRVILGLVIIGGALVGMAATSLTTAAALVALLAGVFVIVVPSWYGILAVVWLGPYIDGVKGITSNHFAPLIPDGITACLAAVAIYEGARVHAIEGMDLAVLAFVLLGVLELLNPNIPSVYVGLFGFQGVYFQALAFPIGRFLLNERNVPKLMHWIQIALIPAGLYAFKQYFSPGAFDYRLIAANTANFITFTYHGHLRAFGLTSGPFQLGLCMVLLAEMAIIYPVSRSLVWRILIPVLGAAGVVLTITRANMIALAVGLGVISLFRVRVRSDVGRMFVWMGFGVAGVLGFIYAVHLVSVSSHMAERLAYWRTTVIPAIFAHPVLGYGTGSAEDGLGPSFLGRSFFSAHNLLLQVQIETGLFGALLITGIIFVALWKSWRLARTGHPLGLLSLTFLISYVVSGVSGSMLEAYPPNWYLWCLLGLASTTLKLRGEHDGHLVFALSRWGEGTT